MNKSVNDSFKDLIRYFTVLRISLGVKRATIIVSLVDCFFIKLKLLSIN